MHSEGAQFLTARFYAWEQRGRGWYTCDMPIDLEPPFHPFLGHVLPPMAPVDDGKRHTLASSLLSLVQGKKEQPVYTAYDTVHDIPEPIPFIFDCEEDVTVYKIALPKEHKLNAKDIEQLLVMLSYTERPVSFEIVGAAQTITIQLACRESDAQHVYSQLAAYFPIAVITAFPKGRELLQADVPTCIVDFGLSNEFMRPLRMADELEQDPFIGLMATLEHLRQGQRGVVQVLFKGAVNPWAASIMHSVTDNKGGSFFSDAPDMVKYAEQKVSAPLFGVCIRVAGQGETRQDAIDIASNIGKAVIRLTKSRGNSLMPLSQEIYPFEDMLDDMYLRMSHRSGMLLNSKELATLVHLPSASIASAKLERDTKKTKAAPESTIGHAFELGINEHHTLQETVTVPASLRLRHTHIIGATGTGKSTLLLSMIAQDMQLGNGLAVLDPHGDLIESILPHIPARRIDDVIIVDPADGEYPVAFNILSAHSEVEKDILSSDLVAAFRRLSTSWGDQMNSVFANAILAFLESPQGGTLVDLRRFLIEKKFRDEYLKTVSDPHIVYYWEHEHPLLKTNSIGSILTRLDTFLRPKLIRNMVAQKKGLDFEHILDSKKILLVKLSQGLIGAENSFLLGTFFVSKMYQAAMARQAKSHAERRDFFLYIDEFQNFITPSMSYILSGARKYHLGLILAHQDMQQLAKYDTELASSVVVNAGTRICFRLGDVDARRFASGFSYFDASDLENLHTGEAIMRIEQPSMDFNLSTLPLPTVADDVAETMRRAAIEKSREKYGTPLVLVEQTTEQPPTVQDEPAQTMSEIPVVSLPQVQPEPTEPKQVAEYKKIVGQKSAKKLESEHRRLQVLIKKLAESRGYKAAIEEATPDGKGRVDISLERAGKKIACEISVTTGDTWEAHNIEKCIAAGYDEIVVCSEDLKNLERIQQRIDSLYDTNTRSRIFLFEPKEMVKHFDKQIVSESATETVMKGYRVIVEYDTASEEQMREKHRHVVQAVAESKKKT